MGSHETSFETLLEERCPLENSRFFGKVLGNYGKFYGKMLSETERITHTRWPVPREIYHQFKQIEDGVVQVRPNLRQPNHNDVWATRMLGPRIGAEAIFWPSPVPKVLYLSAINSRSGSGLFPDYDHSCKELDDLLMGSVPFSFFTDMSRAGVPGVTKAYGYVPHKLKKQESAGLRNELDIKHTLFYRKYGMFGCIPITSRVDMFEYIQANELDAYLIPGSSVAESFATLSRRLGSGKRNHPLIKEISELKGQSWVSQSERSGTNMLTDLMDGYLRYYFPDLYWMLYLAETTTLMGDPRLTNYSHPYVTFLSWMVMKYIEEGGGFKLPFGANDMDRYWRNNVSKTNPESVAADLSELVVRTRGELPLKPLPWQGFVLFGHKNRYVQNSPEQMRANAQLIRQFYPQSWIFMMMDNNGLPLEYDVEKEKKSALHAYDGLGTTTVSSALQGIAEFSIGSQAQIGIERIANLT